LLAAAIETGGPISGGCSAATGAGRRFPRCRGLAGRRYRAYRDQSDRVAARWAIVPGAGDTWHWRSSVCSSCYIRMCSGKNHSTSRGAAPQPGWPVRSASVTVIRLCADPVLPSGRRMPAWVTAPVSWPAACVDSERTAYSSRPENGAAPHAAGNRALKEAFEVNFQPSARRPARSLRRLSSLTRGISALTAHASRGKV